MARINITRFPDATPEYDPVQFNALIRLLEQIVKTLNTTYQYDLSSEAEAQSWFMEH
tara:strand:- start:321 stop:491 length:171 start_codon:yes stop_codon:yes gene_type:complete